MIDIGDIACGHLAVAHDMSGVPTPRGVLVYLPWQDKLPTFLGCKPVSEVFFYDQFVVPESGVLKLFSQS